MLDKYKAMFKCEKNNITTADCINKRTLCIIIGNHNKEQFNQKLLDKWTSKASKTINYPYNKHLENILYE